MNDMFEKSKKKIIAIISAMVPDAKIYLYGSRARGDYRYGSDIDIALDTGSPIEQGVIGELSDLMQALSIGHNVDIVDFNHIPAQLKVEITRDKVVWKD